MATNSNRPRRPDPEENTGKPLPHEAHPRIEARPDVMEGHAHLRGSDVRVAHALRSLAHAPLPTVFEVLGWKGRDGDVQACLLYSADMIELLPDLVAQNDQLKEKVKVLDARVGQKKGKP